MGTMNAALQSENGAFRIASLPRPVAGPGEALIRVRAAGICGSDQHSYGARESAETTPGGHEVTGEIAEVGHGVAPSRIGERVAVDQVQGRACGECWYCGEGQYQHCQNGMADAGGGFAEYMKRRAVGCYPLPDILSWEEGALVEPLAVSVHGLRLSRLHAGETVAVLGAGNIGLTAVAAARALGAGRVFVTARHEQQAAMAKSLGADEVVTPEGDALKETVARATEGRGADLTIETVGGESDATLNQAMEVTRSFGRVVVLGLFIRPVALDLMQALIKEQAIIPANSYSVIDGRHDYEIAIDLMASGRVRLKQMVTHRFPLAQIRQAFETAVDKSTGSIKVQVLS